MKKLKVQFFLFFVFLISLIAVLLWYSYGQIKNEEKRVWQDVGQNVFHQIQANISDLLLQEDKRSFSEYRYYYIPETQLNNSFALNVSPLAQLPNTTETGLIGYFMIDPDGKFTTPYLPSKKEQKKLDDLNKRQEKETLLKNLIATLVVHVKGEVQLKSKPSFLNTTKEKESKKISRSKIYPNPLKQVYNAPKTKSLNPDKASGSPQFMDDADAIKEEELTQETIVNTAQIQTFKEQRPLPSISSRSEGNSDIAQIVIESVGTQQQEILVFTNPFKAQLLDNKHIVFYRHLWANKQMYTQGFVISVWDFFKAHMKIPYQNSHLKDFCILSLTHNKNVLAFEPVSKTPFLNNPILLNQNLGFPLNQFSLALYHNKLPALTSRTFLNSLAWLLSLLSTLGLYLIYRTAKAQVVLSTKRQDFVSAVTHELKTPLTSIRLYSEMLNEGWAKTVEKQKEYLFLITKESDRLSRLIENVLQLSRLEKKNYAYHLETKDPKDDFMALAKEFKTITNQQGFEFITHYAPDNIQITYDSDAVKQILYTLIDNSMKFCLKDNKKLIEMSLYKKESHIIWSIKDHGPGVSPDEIKKIFTKFYRTENEQIRKTKGTGIGLAMAKMLAEGMGARLDAVNLDEGFEVRIIFNNLKQ